ncbi:uncharacterized protein [Drosophila takahashii]|uniref:uncharacterized protein n=1 Tax=Drosophila takahashii TaxID=29030 RepID=UPI001CF8D4F2|nr:uncharacterized protein LOC108066696 [Drosophila takahashii]
MVLNMTRGNLAHLIYGTALLTAISVTPLVTLESRLGYPKRINSAKFFYPNILGPAIVSLVLTILTMVPRLMNPNRWHKENKGFFLLMLPWILFCCLKFAHNFELLSKTTVHVWDEEVWMNLMVLLLVAYCLIFCLALEQMLSWCTIYLMMTDDMITWRLYLERRLME